MRLARHEPTGTHVKRRNFEPIEGMTRLIRQHALQFDQERIWSLIQTFNTCGLLSARDRAVIRFAYLGSAGALVVGDLRASLGRV